MKNIEYKSTRGGTGVVTASKAILQGIAGDGGLYVPTPFPEEVPSLGGLSYQETASKVMALFFSDFSEKELRQCAAKAYDEKFSEPEIAPLVNRAGACFLELFHGPTLAFKDMALTVLPHLLKIAVDKQSMEREIVILTATSGDTGKAALEGFADVDGTRLIVFFPEDGVSDIQKRQMVTQKGKNTHVFGIKGNFDDAQASVKEMFADSSFARELEKGGFVLSSANSINIGRLVPQVAYYFYAYAQACAQGIIKQGEKLNFAVPTGNFGNILAGYYAGMLGLPTGRFICASNENKVLYEFFQTGVYDRNREFVLTSSPSMDILVSSNLERLLYHAGKEDATMVKRFMQGLSDDGKYEVTEEMKQALSNFYGTFATQEDVEAVIREVFNTDGYLMDTHTAVAYAAWQKYREQTGDGAETVIVSTASPYKFTREVMKALSPGYAEYDSFKLLEEMSRITDTAIPPAIKDLEDKPILHKATCTKTDMRKEVLKVLGL